MVRSHKEQGLQSLTLTKTPILPPPPQPSPSSSASSSRKRPQQEPSSHHHRPPSLKRVKSNGSTVFSASTKEQVKDLDNGDLCWHCGATPTDICHVITKADHEFEVYKSRGLVNIDSPSHLNNGIPLCALCHRNFDDLYNPGFVFFPTDLDYFKLFEEQDRARRVEHFNRHRTSLKRTCPSPEDYRQHQLRRNLIGADEHGGLYERVILRDYLPKIGCCRKSRRAKTGNLFPPASWHGDPMAALRRGFAIIGSITLDGLHSAKRRCLQELHNLYLENDDALRDMTYDSESETDQDSESSVRMQDSANNGTSAQATYLLPSDGQREASIIARPQNSSANTRTQPSSILPGEPTAVDKMFPALQEPLVLDGQLKDPSLPSLGCQGTRRSMPTLDSLQSSHTSLDSSSHMTAPAKVTRIQSSILKRKGDWRWGPCTTADDIMDFYRDIQRI